MRSNAFGAIMMNTERSSLRARQMLQLGAVLLLALASAIASGQAPVIASFRQNGLLVFTNLQPGTMASVL
jgi:hypothetical protein